MFNIRSILMISLMISCLVSPSSAVDEYSAEEQQMLVLINEARLQNGLDPLSFNPLLNEAASEHSKEMIEMDYFSHDSYDGTGFAQRLLAWGYTGTYMGENIAMRYPPNVVLAFEGLMDSPGHRANILSPNYNEIGIGIWVGEYDSYPETAMYTQDFGWSDSVIPTLMLEDSYPAGDSISSDIYTQTFNADVSMAADMAWYLDGVQVQMDRGVASSSYTASVGSAGTHIVEVSATDSLNTVSRSWTWEVLPAETIKGDFNGDGDVNIVDLGAFSRVYNSISTEESIWADFNEDGSIDIIDLGAFARVYNK